MKFNFILLMMMEGRRKSGMEKKFLNYILNAMLYSFNLIFINYSFSCFHFSSYFLSHSFTLSLFLALLAQQYFYFPWIIITLLITRAEEEKVSERVRVRWRVKILMNDLHVVNLITVKVVLGYWNLVAQTTHSVRMKGNNWKSNFYLNVHYFWCKLVKAVRTCLINYYCLQ